MGEVVTIHLKNTTALLLYASRLRLQAFIGKATVAFEVDVKFHARSVLA